MVLEYIRYSVPLDQSGAFADAYRRAAVLLKADPHCLGFEVSQGVEELDNWVVRMGGISVEGHEQGFRRLPGFRNFFAEVRPSFDRSLKMKLYQVLAADERDTT